MPIVIRDLSRSRKKKERTPATFPRFSARKARVVRRAAVRSNEERHRDLFASNLANWTGQRHASCLARSQRPPLPLLPLLLPLSLFLRITGTGSFDFATATYSEDDGGGCLAKKSTEFERLYS